VGAGEDIIGAISRGIRSSNKVLLCCSRASLNSWWVDAELRMALSKERALSAQRQKRVEILLPLDFDGYVFSRFCSSDYAPYLTSRNIIQFTSWNVQGTDFRRAISKVVRSLR